MKIAIIAIVIIAIVTISIDREITRSLTLPKFALRFACGVLPIRLIYHMMGFRSILIFMKIAIIAIVIIAIVTIAIDRKITRSPIWPKFALGFTRGALQVRLIYHMMGFHSALIFMKIAIIASAIIATAAIDREITRLLTLPKFGPGFTRVVLPVRFD